MKTSFLCILPLIFLFNSSVARQSSDSTRSDSERIHKFDPARDAAKDVQDAIRLARQTHKRILLDVGGEWCIWCHRLDSLFLQHKDLAAYLNNHYVVVKVNVSKENKNEKFLSQYPKVAGYPHLFVLDQDGKFLHSQDTGELEYPANNPVKGHDKKKVFHFLETWTE